MSTEIQENISPDKTNQITEKESTSAKATKASVKKKKKRPQESCCWKEAS